MGFSGGARTASLVAITYGGVNGIIACGAGFPQTAQPIGTRFSFFGMAGTEDFNFLEMQHLDGLLGNAIPHQFISFQGKHDWPSEKNMEDAFLWLEVNAMRDSLIQRADSTILRIRKKFENQLAEYKNKGDEFNAALVCGRLCGFLKNLTYVSGYEKQLKQFEKSPGYKKTQKEKSEAELWETSLQKEYANQFSIENIQVMEKEIVTLKSDTLSTVDSFRTISAKRLLSFISMLSYMYSSGAIKSGQLEAADSFLKIYRQTDPENPDYFYLSACLAADRGRTDEAFALLEKAVKKGFYDKEILSAEKSFNNIRSNPRFHQIEESIK
jgi:hypothetical protein